MCVRCTGNEHHDLTLQHSTASHYHVHSPNCHLAAQGTVPVKVPGRERANYSFAVNSLVHSKLLENWSACQLHFPHKVRYQYLEMVPFPLFPLTSFTCFAVLIKPSNAVFCVSASVFCLVLFALRQNGLSLSLCLCRFVCSTAFSVCVRIPKTLKYLELFPRPRDTVAPLSGALVFLFLSAAISVLSVF